ncbi:hypothetical protein I601_0510 [Nocardioides dokdonensis FR1436]|uniref:Uncharacterized protein n=1 Tax=Nocardioides dokdonensis FR1436 TaxID=1300347 RepID=A0A1A9GH50_9ACTN|nr:hypothetical protein [Nocardioides dokdonensis]ANH36962.1 hypothetical protein I601_0510 [Nocardioides dokdonensis FR1436]
MSSQDPRPDDTHGRHRDRPPAGHIRGDHPVGATSDPSMGFGTSPEDRLHLPETPLDSGRRAGSGMWLVLALVLAAVLLVVLVLALL